MTDREDSDYEAMIKKKRQHPLMVSNKPGWGNLAVWEEEVHWVYHSREIICRKKQITLPTMEKEKEKGEEK